VSNGFPRRPRHDQEDTVAHPTITTDTEGLTWVRSSFNTGDGVEVAQRDLEQIFVRDARFPGELRLVFSVREWLEFISGVKAGEFDPRC
jgi:hypothetical protein